VPEHHWARPVACDFSSTCEVPEKSIFRLAGQPSGTTRAQSGVFGSHEGSPLWKSAPPTAREMSAGKIALLHDCRFCASLH
jgi:hypothetical protein